METNYENQGPVRDQDYDDAIKMSQGIELQEVSLGYLATPLGLELQLATFVIACFYPAVWAVLVFFYVAACVASVHRSTARKCLKAHDMKGAKSAFDKAKTWNTLSILTEVAMACIEFWALAQFLNHIKPR
jgi:hypothetical protein